MADSGLMLSGEFNKGTREVAMRNLSHFLGILFMIRMESYLQFIGLLP